MARRARSHTLALPSIRSRTTESTTRPIISHHSTPPLADGSFRQMLRRTRQPRKSATATPYRGDLTTAPNVFADGPTTSSCSSCSSGWIRATRGAFHTVPWTHSFAARRTSPAPMASGAGGSAGQPFDPATPCPGVRRTLPPARRRHARAGSHEDRHEFRRTAGGPELLRVASPRAHRDHAR